jgi:hypothetical protein
MKNFLVITPKFGLCNQLLSISNGIICGLISNRDIIFKGFQLDFRNSENICNFDQVIDIEYIQNIINNKNINVKLYSNTDIIGNKINTFTDLDISYIEDFIPLLFKKENINIEYLNIENPISTIIPNQYHEDYKYINLNLKFTKKYIDIAESIKNKLNLHLYSCIHLRLEDDSINYMKSITNKYDLNTINEIYINKYLKEIDYLHNNIINIRNLNNLNNNNEHKIYVCTSLNIDNNLNNEFYKTIKEKYNLLDKNDIINIFNEKTDCREILAIIDFIIAHESIYFIGSDWSSYSIYLYNNHIYNGKSAKLIDIWNELTK